MKTDIWMPPNVQESMQLLKWMRWIQNRLHDKEVWLPHNTSQSKQGHPHGPELFIQSKKPTLGQHAKAVQVISGYLIRIKGKIELFRQVSVFGCLKISIPLCWKYTKEWSCPERRECLSLTGPGTTSSFHSLKKKKKKKLSFNSMR